MEEFDLASRRRVSALGALSILRDAFRSSFAALAAFERDEFRAPSMFWRPSPSTLVRLVQTMDRFKGDERGNVALIFGLSCVMIFVGMGAGLDLSRAYLARQ